MLAAACWCLLLLLAAAAQLVDCICAMVLSWWIVFLVYLCHILVQGSNELPIIAEMLIHFRFGENGALLCP